VESGGTKADGLDPVAARPEGNVLPLHAARDRTPIAGIILPADGIASNWPAAFGYLNLRLVGSPDSPDRHPSSAKAEQGKRKRAMTSAEAASPEDRARPFESAHDQVGVHRQQGTSGRTGFCGC